MYYHRPLFTSGTNRIWAECEGSKPVPFGHQGGLLPSLSLKDWIGKLLLEKKAHDDPISHTPNIRSQTSGSIRSVFVSYRRSGEASSLLARTIRAELRRRGCAVFLDVDSLRTGRFDDALLHEIENAQNFLVILSPDCLQRAINKGDWFRTELAHALSIDRNIVPIMMDAFTWPEPEQLPADIRNARRYHGLRYSHDYFEAMMDKVEGFLRH